MNLQAPPVEIKTPHRVVVLCTTIFRTTADICSPTSSTGLHGGFRRARDDLGNGTHARFFGTLVTTEGPSWVLQMSPLSRSHSRLAAVIESHTFD